MSSCLNQREKSHCSTSRPYPCVSVAFIMAAGAAFLFLSASRVPTAAAFMIHHNSNHHQRSSQRLQPIIPLDQSSVSIQSTSSHHSHLQQNRRSNLVSSEIAKIGGKVISSETSSTRKARGRSRRPFLAVATFCFVSACFLTSLPAVAAPPFAVIAEELGYFPVTNRQGQTVYVPQPIRRDSSQQALDLAKQLHDKGGAILAGTYWCPHTTHQKQILGKQVLGQYVPYVECSPRGFQAQPAYCVRNKVEGYPTWIFTKLPNQPSLSGERSLTDLAQFIGYTGTIQPELEQNLPTMGTGTCSLKK